MNVGDRGNVVINVPAPVVPYVPTLPEQGPDQIRAPPNRTRVKKIRQRVPSTSTTQKTPKKTSDRMLASSSEDFEAFSTVTDRSTTMSTSVNDLAYEETDRIDVPNLLLPGAVTSSDPMTNKLSVAVPSVSGPGRAKPFVLGLGLGISSQATLGDISLHVAGQGLDFVKLSLRSKMSYNRSC